jgi:hypothetical protein
MVAGRCPLQLSRPGCPRAGCPGTAGPSGPRIAWQNYALRACFCALLVGPMPALASGSQVAGGGGRWLLMAVRGHQGDTLLSSPPRIWRQGNGTRGAGSPTPVQGRACRVRVGRQGVKQRGRRGYTPRGPGRQPRGGQSSCCSSPSVLARTRTPSLGVHPLAVGHPPGSGLGSAGEGGAPHCLTDLRPRGQVCVGDSLLGLSWPMARG